MGMYQGVNASEGIGIGTVMVAVDPDLTFEPHEVADSAAEKSAIRPLFHSSTRRPRLRPTT